VLREEWTSRRLAMSLRPEVNKLEELRGKLYSKAKIEPTFRFYALYDKVYRWDVLTEALRLSREKKGAPGVDGQTFDQIREYGEERWLQELQRELHSWCIGRRERTIWEPDRRRRQWSGSDRDIGQRKTWSSYHEQ
jgi:hypothetical protein